MMDNSFLQKLFAASESEKKAALIAEAFFDTLSKEAALVARRCSLLHWFDHTIVEALLRDITYKKGLSTKIYEQIRLFPFVEVLPWGLAYNALTRDGLLNRYIIAQPELLKTAALLAAPAYKVHRNDTKIIAECFFCYIIAGETALASKLLNELVQKAEKRGDQEYIDGLQEYVKEAQEPPFGLSLSYAEILEFHHAAAIKNQKTIAQPKRIASISKRLFHKIRCPFCASTLDRDLLRCHTCGRHLPSNIEYVDDNISIAVVGSTYSGKSHYIASCINQLKQLSTLQELGISHLAAQGDTDQRYRDNYYKCVYEQKTMIPLTSNATPTINEPLIYELFFQKKSVASRYSRVNLLFYDCSGEDIVSQTRMVFNASAIIFLADPLSMPQVVKALPAHLTSEVMHLDRTSEVLDRIAQTLARYKRISPSSRLKTPIAITISKSDLLKYFFKYASRTPLFIRNDAYSSNFSRKEFDIIDEEVRHFLQSVGNQELVASSQAFENVNFFAVSATGWSIDPKENKYPTIEPVRCLEPLLWALYKIGVIASG